MTWGKLCLSVAQLYLPGLVFIRDQRCFKFKQHFKDFRKAFDIMFLHYKLLTAVLLSTVLNAFSRAGGTDWATGHCKFGWCVDGIFPSGTDGTHINGVDLSEDQTTICVGDDYGLVTLFRNPCRKGHQPKSLRGHSEHVVRVKFGRGEHASRVWCRKCFWRYT